jgi:uroporphyrinogen-III synthase
MLSDIKERPAKLLYLTGDKNRDTLPNILTEGGITLEALQVYETVGSPRFEEQLLCVLDDAAKGKPDFRTS